MSQFLENQNWRYSAKKFDTSRIVSEQDLTTLKEAIRLSPSSYGLQPYKVLIVENLSIREKLRTAAWGQAQITDASHLFVFANDINFDGSKIDQYIENISNIREIPVENLLGYSDFMKSKLIPLEYGTKADWTSKQAYLALGNLLNAAADLRIDVTPMEGFDTFAFNEILGLEQLGVSASVAAAVGYRHTEDATQHYKKVRKSNEELFIYL